MYRFQIFCLIAIMGLPNPAWACPFCSATAQTLRQDMAAMDVVCFGELLAPTKNGGKEPSESLPGEIAGVAEFKVIESLRGTEIVPKDTVISAPYYGPSKTNGRFLLMGVNQTEVLWSSPLPVTSDAEKYLAAVNRLKDDRIEKLTFYLSYLEHPEPLLARDAYEEFAQTPYDDVKAIRSYLSRPKLIEWLKSVDVAPDRKRLYYTLLGICAEKSDAVFLESLLKSKDDTIRAGLDALIACYLTVIGESGLPLVEDLFLKNPKASYPDTFAAVMALRFHGTEGGVIERSKIVQSMRWMLERPDFADLVIPDLARWEDWTQIDRLAKLFVEADDSSSWVRVPVVNYLRACPLPEAKTTLVELEKIDPKAVKRAATFFPIPQPATPATPSSAATGETKSENVSPTEATKSTNDEKEAKATPAPSLKNDTSSLGAESHPTYASVMRMPLGARGPLALNARFHRENQVTRSSSIIMPRQSISAGRGSQHHAATQLSMGERGAFPDFMVNDAPAIRGVSWLGLCGAGLLSATTMLMMMWMILSGATYNEPTIARRGWAMAHRWTHGAHQARPKPS